MAYEPLHHKYRPQTFADLVGQEAIAQTLTNAIKQNRIAPAYLFTGARGTGKTSSARIMAKSLNCISYNVPTPIPCGQCDMCLNVSKGIALDITEIDAASNTGVDNIRELIERAQFAPVQARYKVYIIDEVHMLSNAAFNALLKTLEEPPDRVTFILATTDPQRVLPTIISRCQRFDFRRIPLEAMGSHLQKIAQLEEININSEAVTLVAQMAQGGLRDAESLLDQLSLSEGEITVEAVWNLVGSVPEKDLLLLLEAIATHNSTLILEQLRHIMDRGREPLIVLQNLAGLYRDLLIAQSAPERGDLIALTSSGWERLKQLASAFHFKDVLAGQQHLRAAEVQIKNTTQPRLWLEVTVLSLLSLISSSTGSDSVKPTNGNLNNYLPSVAEFPKLTIAPSPTSINSSISVPEETKVEVILSNQLLADSASDRPAKELIPQAVELVNNLEEDKPAAVENTEIEIVATDFIAPTTPQSFPTETKIEVKVESPREPVGISPNLEAAWRDLMNNLAPAPRGLLEQHGRFLNISETTVKIGLKHLPLKKIAEQKRDAIAQSCQQVFNRPIQVVFELINPNNTNKSTVKLPSETPKPPSPTVISQPYSSVAKEVIQEVIKEVPNVANSMPPQPENIVEPDLEIPKDTTMLRSPEYLAVKNVAEFFQGQIIDLEPKAIQ